MMTAARPPRRAAGNVLYMPDRRQPARPGAGRDAGAAPLEHWNAEFRPQRAEAFDQIIIMTWKLHIAGAFGFDEAGMRHNMLVRLRDGRGQ